MKTRYSNRRLTTIALASGLLTTGCTHIANRRDKTKVELEEHSRALTTAVVETLQAETNREPQVEFALKLAREDQRIEGLPLTPIQLAPVNERDLAQRFDRIEKLIMRERKAADRLIELGETQEQEQNRSRVRVTKWLGSGTVVIGGLIALMVFLPASIPIVGRIVAWIVSKIPALASAVGFVSVKAFDAVVKGIERSRSTHLGSSGKQPEDDLLVNLSREMDGAHKALVRSRKGTLRQP